jgi:hypothetical protein
MKDIYHHYFSSYIGNIKDTRTVSTFTLDEMLREITDPDDATKRLVHHIRNAKDAEEKARLKMQLKAWTPVVLCAEKRRISEIIGYSGLMPLDFDKLPDAEYAVELKNFLFDNIPSLYAVWLSSSGKGVRAIVYIPIVHEKSEYVALFEGFRREIVEEYSFIDYFDSAPKNPVLPLFQSYDPNMRFRIEADIFNAPYYPVQAPVKTYPPLSSPDDKDKAFVIRKTIKGIEKITDNGHPQMCGVALALGGYVGGGYIDYSEAIDLMHTLIERNSYLSQKADIYKKSAKEMIQYGTKRPIYL